MRSIGAFVTLAAAAAAAAQPLLTTNQAEAVTNLERCGYHPYIAPRLTLAITGASPDAPQPSVDRATIALTASGTGNDTIRVDPDPTILCAWGAPSSTRTGDAPSCSPCGPLLNVSSSGGLSNGTTLTITGSAPPAVYESCLRRVFLGSVAFGGEEGLGQRTLTFTAHLAGSPPETVSTGQARVDWVADPTGGTACSDVLPTGPMLRFENENPPAAVYQAACVGACGGSPSRSYYVLLQPGLIVSYPSAASATVPSAMQYATVIMDWKRLQGVQAREQDRFWALPVPGLGGTVDAPCGPNITLYSLFSLAEDTMPAYQGLALAGAASTAAYTSCLQVVYYFNLAAQAGNAGAVVPGVRLFETSVHSPQVSGIASYMGLGRNFSVEPASAGCTQSCPSSVPVVGPATLTATPAPPSPFPSATPLSTQPPSSGASSGSSQNAAVGASLESNDAVGAMLGAAALTVLLSAILSQAALITAWMPRFGRGQQMFVMALCGVAAISQHVDAQPVAHAAAACGAVIHGHERQLRRGSGIDAAGDDEPAPRHLQASQSRTMTCTPALTVLYPTPHPSRQPGTPSVFALTWYGAVLDGQGLLSSATAGQLPAAISGLCDSAVQTTVLGSTGVLQAIPGAVAGSTWAVRCNDFGGGGVVVLSLASAIGAAARDITVPFVSGQCIRLAREMVSVPGTGELRVTCGDIDSGSLRPKKHGAAAVTWFPDSGNCGTPDSKLVAMLPSSVCFSLPNRTDSAGADPLPDPLPARSYRVECNSGGTGGAFVAYRSQVCGTDLVKGVSVQSFDNRVCMRLPAPWGEGSASFDCAPLGDVPSTVKPQSGAEHAGDGLRVSIALTAAGAACALAAGFQWAVL